jgi:hypothetical protein
MNNLSIEEAIQLLPLPTLARRIAIAGEIPERDGKTVSCWFPENHPNGDRNPSFNLHSGLTRFKCFSCGIEGRGPDLIAHALHLKQEDAVKRFIEMAGGVSPDAVAYRPKETKRKPLALPSDLHKGCEAEIEALAALRGFSPHAVALAVGMGVLRFGTVHGSLCWIVGDQSRKAAEARRMDGELFPPVGDLKARKVHTLSGSLKAWPVGIQPFHSKPEKFTKIIVVEGSADLIAAYHFLLEREIWDALPVAMLGSKCRTIDSEALKLFQGRAVKIIAHADDAGREAVRGWAEQVAAAGAEKVTLFNLAGLLKSDGSPITDLNDCVHVRAEDQSELEGLFS